MRLAPKDAIREMAKAYLAATEWADEDGPAPPRGWSEHCKRIQAIRFVAKQITEGKSPK